MRRIVGLGLLLAASVAGLEAASASPASVAGAIVAGTRAKVAESVQYYGDGYGERRREEEWRRRRWAEERMRREEWRRDRWRREGGRRDRGWDD
jgi:hypothetical protein